MIVWTHHKSSFPILAPDLVIDPTKGKYWDTPGYPVALRRLHEAIGTSQFLWCLTVPQEWFVFDDENWLKWELDVPDSHDAWLYREDVWQDLINGRSDVWDSLMVDELGEKVGALVRVPIDPNWATCESIEPHRRR